MTCDYNSFWPLAAPTKGVIADSIRNLLKRREAARS